MNTPDTIGVSPYTAILVQSYGGPTGPDTVLPFLRNATRGRGIPDERLLAVGEHYQLFGGVSPINECNARLLDALRTELASRGVDVPVVIGNRNWEPYVTDAVGQLADDGHTRVLSVATSAYGSYSGCRQYTEDAQAALEALGPDATLVIDRLAPYSDAEGFAVANADALSDAIQKVDAVGQSTGDSPLVLFTTHSIPTAMNEASGGTRGTYVVQHQRVCERVAALAGERLGRPVAWELVYCSRSGSPHTPWLEPDINDRLHELASDGVRSVVAAPVGFISDHMEVVYDLDTEAAATARELGIGFVRAATVGVHPAFVAALADEIIAHADAVRAGRIDPTLGPCGTVDCCLPRPAGSPAPHPTH